MRKSYSFLPDQDFIPKALQFAEKESHVVYLNPNSYTYPYGPFKHLLAFGAWEELKGSDQHFKALQQFISAKKEWVVGYLSYDLKNEIESLVSQNKDLLAFPSISFFIPKHLIFFGDKEIEIQSTENPEAIYQSILLERLTNSTTPLSSEIEQQISREDYLSKVKKLQEHIREGDIYEVNFCMEYFVRDITVNPLALYQQLNRRSAMPFSSFLKINDHYLACASPERFLKKEGPKIISQPIKGTARRYKEAALDQESKNSLLQSSKEKAENIMIVDLVRNDLSLHAIPGTVKADEVCKVYTFPTVHQMISTVVAEVDPSIDPVEIVKAAFPMGSMTGAPKVKAMKLIEEYEETKRGLFSGAVGYFSPEGDFDFNVVIRSILYNAETRYLSFQAGSAITFYSDAEKEYEECAVKTAAIREVLQS